MCAQKQPPHIEIPHSIKVFSRQQSHGRKMSNSGVVDKYVQPPKLSGDLRENLLNLWVLSQIRYN